MHDYSITTAMAVKGTVIERDEGEIFMLKPISIGDNTFIGARSTILPGTSIGKNCIVGACAVVKGVISDNSVVVGNPAKVVASTDSYINKHLDKGDYFTAPIKK